MAQDEGRFGRRDRLRAVASRLSTVRPTVPCQMVWEFVYVFAAVCASLGCLTTLILPMANTRE